MHRNTAPRVISSSILHGMLPTSRPKTRHLGIRAPFTSRCPPRPLSAPRLTAAKAGPEPLPPLVEQLLRTPGLESPEGSSPEQMLRVTEAFWRVSNQIFKRRLNFSNLLYFFISSYSN